MDFKDFKDFITKQHCLPWRILKWLSYHLHSLYMILMYFRTNINTQKYWEGRGYKNDYINKERLSFFKEIANKITSGSLVLDIGCGEGSFMKLLEESYNTLCYGVDFSYPAIEHLKDQHLKGAVGLVTQLPFKNNRFDVVTAIEVFEHLSVKNCKKTIIEMKRVCKKNGVIIVTVPTTKFLIPQIEPEHLRAYTLRDIQNFLSEFIKETNIEVSTNGIYWICCGRNMPISNQ